MKIQSILFAVLLTAEPVYADSYTSMGIPGDCFPNTWNTTDPALTKISDNVWQGTGTITQASGAFKFAANGNWDVNWGGAGSFSRVPAIGVGPLSQGDSDITFTDLPIGQYRFTFDTSTLRFSMEPVSASAPPAVQSVQLIGNFNSQGGTDAGQFTRSAGNTNEWTLTGLTLSTMPDACQFRVTLNGGAVSDWGGASAFSLEMPLNTAVTGAVPGNTAFSLTGLGGTFNIVLNTASNTFTITRTASTATAAYIALRGRFAGNQEVSINMQSVGGSLWRSEHWITNSGTSSSSLYFIGYDTNGAASRYWGSTNSSVANANNPVIGVMVQTNAANVSPLVISGAAGRYQITFNEQTGEFTYICIYRTTANLNLLANSSFEETEEAYGQISPTSWNRWPRLDFIRAVDHTNYFIHSGFRSAAIQRLYSDWEDYAGFDQDISVTSYTGRNLRVSAYIRKAGIISPNLVEIQVTWRNGTNDLSIDSQRVLGLTESWQFYSLEAAVPTNATLAHVVFRVSGFAGASGAILFDDVEARVVAGRTQNFDAWGNISAYQRIGFDWIASDARTILNEPEVIYGDVLFSKYIEGSDNNKALELFNGTPNTVNLSGYYIDQYNNGSTTPDASIPLSGSVPSLSSFVVTRTDDGAATTPDLALRNAANHKTALLTFNGDDVLVLRNGSTVLDRIGTVSTNATGAFWTLATKDHTLTRHTSITNGLTTAVTNPFQLNEWIIGEKDNFSDLGTHSFTEDSYLPSGYSLLMRTNSYLISGELSGGIGAVSFYYRPTGSGGDPGKLILETSSTFGADISTNAEWIVRDEIILTSSPPIGFTYYLADISDASALFLRFRHEAASGSTNSIRLDDIFIEPYSAIKRIQKFTGWTQTNAGTYTKDGWTIADARIILDGAVNGSEAARLLSTSSSIISPTFASGSGETTFLAMLDPEDGSPARLSVQYTEDDGATWIDSGTYISLDATNIVYSISAFIYSDVPSRVRITYADDSSGTVLVDDIYVAVPIYYLSQNFNTWPLKPNLESGTALWEGWQVSSTMVNGDYAVSGYSAKLSATVGSHSAITSGYIPDGIVGITFQAARGGTSGTHPYYLLEFSEDGVTWTNIHSFTFANNTFQSFAYFNSDTNTIYHYARLYHQSGANVAYVDDIVLIPLGGRPYVVGIHSISPTMPMPTDIIALTASVYGQNSPDLLSITGYFSTNGTIFTALPMSLVSVNSYFATIGTYPAGTKLYTYIEVIYGGLGAGDGNGYSTNTFRTATQTNGVSTVEAGSIWINEVFYANYRNEWEADREFIELCGVEGIDLSGWTIELAFGRETDIIKNNNNAVYASYTIPTNTILQGTSSNGTHGFYVLGDQELLTAGESVNQILTNFVPAAVNPWAEWDRDHVYDGVGVIRLLDQYGTLRTAISYAGYDIGGATYIGMSQNVSMEETNSLGIIGTGTYQSDFSWNSGASTIGYENVGQTLILPVVRTADTWHTPSLLVTPNNTNVISTFYMRSPQDAAMWDAIQITFGYHIAEMATPPTGILFYRNQNEGSWKSASMSLVQYSLDPVGNQYVAGFVPAYAYPRLDTISYYIQVNPQIGGYSVAFIGQNNSGTSTIYTNVVDAQANPFSYTLPFVDEIHLVEINVEEDFVWLTSEGNDPTYPITNFRVRSTTSLTNPPATWTTNTATHTYIDSADSGANLFKVIPESDETRFYRLDLLWP